MDLNETASTNSPPTQHRGKAKYCRPADLSCRVTGSNICCANFNPALAPHETSGSKRIVAPLDLADLCRSESIWISQCQPPSAPLISKTSLRHLPFRALALMDFDGLEWSGHWTLRAWPTGLGLAAESACRVPGQAQQQRARCGTVIGRVLHRVKVHRMFHSFDIGQNIRQTSSNIKKP